MSSWPDAELSITAAEKWVQILSGAQTRVWSYEGELLSGSGVTSKSSRYLPRANLRVRSGTKVRIYFTQPGEDSVIHRTGCAYGGL